MMRSRVTAPLVGVLLAASVAAAQVPEGWQKVSGIPETAPYSGVPDGLDPVAADRQNSYAWSMDVLGRHLYVGTNRNVFSLMIQASGRFDLVGPSKPLPIPTDQRARIYRMSLETGQWERVFVGDDTGYRMMKTYAARGQRPVLYVGGSGIGWCRMLALDGTNPPVEVYRTTVANQFLSIRAIAEHDGQLYWATEDAEGPAVFVSPDPLRQAPERVGLPAAWQVGGGAEVADLIGYNGSLYVFFLTKTSDPAQFGFWAARLKKTKGQWTWTPIVGDRSIVPAAKYNAGLGNPENGVAVPFRFHNHVYVGTMDAAAFRVLNNINQPLPGQPAKAWGRWGMEIWRFDQRDNWERVMPAMTPGTPGEEPMRGFGNPNNKYMWRFGVVDGRLHIGTFDVGTGFALLMSAPGLPIVLDPALGFGFDLYSTRDGVEWRAETENGFEDPWNYGARSFATDPATGDLYLGTANPFYGCQVWRRSASGRD